MNKLLMFLFFSSYILSNSIGITSSFYLAYLLFIRKNLDYVSLTILSTFFTYYMYGFFGLFFMSILSLASISSGLMFWYDTTLNDIEKDFQKSIAIDSSDDIETQEVKKKWIDLNNNMNNKMTIFYQKINSYRLLVISDNVLDKMKNWYDYFSSLFDIACGKLYTYLFSFYNFTKDIYGFKTAYFVLQYIAGWVDLAVKKLIKLKTIHKASRDLDAELSKLLPINKLSINKPDTNPVEQIGNIDKMLSLSNIDPRDMLSMMQLFNDSVAKPIKRKTTREFKNL